MVFSKKLEKLVTQVIHIYILHIHTTYSSCISGNGSDNKHEEEGYEELQSKSLSIRAWRHSDTTAHYWMEYPLKRESSAERRRNLCANIHRNLQNGAKIIQWNKPMCIYSSLVTYVFPRKVFESSESDGDSRVEVGPRDVPGWEDDTHDREAVGARDADQGLRPSCLLVHNSRGCPGKDQNHCAYELGSNLTTYDHHVIKLILVEIYI